MGQLVDRILGRDETGGGDSPPVATSRQRAILALEAFWGRSNGGEAAERVLREQLVSLKLPPNELRFLSLNLPASETGVGTTAAKIKRCARLLERMQLEREGG